MERFDSSIFKHVFGRIKFYIYDSEGDETYSLDMPPDVYEELKRLIKEFDNGIIEKDKKDF